MASYPLWAAIRTIRNRIGTWAGYERYTEMVPDISREQWARAIGQARALIVQGVHEVTRPLNRRPVAGEYTVLPTRVATGWMQYVHVYVRDRETGNVEARLWATRVGELRSRASVVTRALASFEAATLPEGTFEGELIVGASYAGTVVLTPRQPGE